MDNESTLTGECEVRDLSKQKKLGLPYVRLDNISREGIGGGELVFPFFASIVG